jgi:ribonuclease/clavin/mitogillin
MSDITPEVRLIPLATHGLPPSTHTNAYLIGKNPAYVLDPGPSEPAELEKLFTILDEHRSTGGRLEAVVLTHQHPDHVGGARAAAERYGVPIWAHALTAAALHGNIEIQREIGDGDRLELGAAPDGRGTWHLQALHTPGHASGHLAFYEPHYRLLFAGDMVSTLSSVVIAPPNGDLSVYLNSLQRLQTLECRLLLPGHGNASAVPRRTIEDCLAHRAKREEQLLAALDEGPRTVLALAAELYKGLSRTLMRLAKLQVEAGLTKLERELCVFRATENNLEIWRRLDDSRDPEEGKAASVS